MKLISGYIIQVVMIIVAVTRFGERKDAIESNGDNIISVGDGIAILNS